MIRLENCPICDTDDWKKLDYLRDLERWYDNDYREEGEQVGFKICKHCGFVTYDYVEVDRLQKLYTQLRPMVRAENVVTQRRKNLYHNEMIFNKLDSHFMDRRKNNLRCLDVGCATGEFLDLLKSYNIFNEYYGTEWSKGFVGYAKNEFGFKITEEIDTSIKYDFISYYHVLEHIQSPDKELAKIRNILNDDGLLYIAVPTWFVDIEEPSGMSCLDFEEYFHLNHVNVFSEMSFLNLMHKCGFEIIKTDKKMYGYAVLCKKTDATYNVVIESYEEKVSMLEIIKTAMDFAIKNDFVNAIKTFPKYPEAYCYLSVNKENQKSLKVQEQLLEGGLKHSPLNKKLKIQLAKLYIQWDENTGDNRFYSNNIKKSERLWNELMKDCIALEEPQYYLGIINGNYKGEYKKAIECFKDVMEANPLRYGEILNLIGYYSKFLS